MAVLTEPLVLHALQLKNGADKSEDKKRKKRS
jgi:hypothetical protein